MSVKTKSIGNDANNRIMIRLDTTKLEALEKELGKAFVAQVGVLGARASGRLKIAKEHLGLLSRNKEVSVASESAKTNAEIGLIHEKGSPPRNIPRRSFLEMPLTTKMPQVISRVGAILLKGINETNIAGAYQKLATIGEGIVLQAFPTQGYGRWPAKSDGEPSRLIDTGQLRQSISSRVVAK